MELFTPLSRFYSVAADDHRIGATHVCLYLAILNQWNTSGGTDSLPIKRQTIMRKAKICSRHTYNRCMNDLHDFGYLIYTRSVNASTSNIVELKKYSGCMETLFIPNENDFKRWVKEAVQEYFQDAGSSYENIRGEETEFISRNEVAKLLKVSLVTLTDWKKRGLPFYKQRGRDYFIKSEVLEYIRKNGHPKRKVFSNSHLFD